MTNPYDKNKAISADEAAKIIPRAEFRVFGKILLPAFRNICGNAKPRFTLLA